MFRDHHSVSTIALGVWARLGPGSLRPWACFVSWTGPRLAMPVTLPGRNTWGGGDGRSAGRSPGGAIHGRRTAPACRRTTTRRGPRARAGVGARHCPAAPLRGQAARRRVPRRRVRVERRAGAWLGAGRIRWPVHGTKDGLRSGQRLVTGHVKILQKNELSYGVLNII